MFRHVHNQDFTLIELLTVATVISLLMAISLPSLDEARQAGFLIVAGCVKFLSTNLVGLRIMPTALLNTK